MNLVAGASRGRVDGVDEKETFQLYLRTRRAHLVGKLDGLSEYDIRRPMTPTGTNLLGLVKHVASVELGYMECFGRRADRELPWFDEGAAPDADMWATADQTRAEIVELHEFAAAHTDKTVAELPLDATGEVPWWPPERRTVTLHQILVHLCVEIAHHCGHADIVREYLDGAVGRDAKGLTHRDNAGWHELHEQIEQAALQAAGR